MKKVFFFAAMAATMLTACASSETAAKKQNLNGEWHIQQVGELDAKGDMNEPMVVFDNKEIHGQSGCNTFFGDLKVSKSGRISVKMQGCTRMSCQGVMVQEEAIIGSLEAARRYNFSNDMLLIVDRHKRVLMTLKK